MALQALEYARRWGECRLAFLLVLSVRIY